MKNAVYLDYNSTTPVKPAVRELVAAVLGETGNASSVHGFGRAAHRRVERAREQVAALAGVHPNQVVFGSGATEANNSVLQAFAGKRVLVSAIEHSSVLRVLPDAETVPATADGLVDRAAFEKMLGAGPPPALVSLMLANNETGAIQPVAELARLAKAQCPGVCVHTDAVQAAGRIAVDFPALYADYMTLSSHKMGGPQGAGALINAPGAPAAVLLRGGGQEKGMRAGTENVAAIAGFGLAAELAVRDMPQFAALRALHDRLEAGLEKITPGLTVFSKNAPRVANTTAIGIDTGGGGPDPETVLMALDLAGIAVSSGSACASGKVKASHVLRALRPSVCDTFAAFRISTGWDSRESDIDRFLEAWESITRKIAGHRKKAEA